MLSVLADKARCWFKFCDLSGADLRGASLREVSLAGCDLRGADLRDTDLTGARIGSVNTGMPPLGLTDVTGARFEGASLRTAGERGEVGVLACVAAQLPHRSARVCATRALA
ncbi:pentapeptide repeat-containing protein [Streptomyces sp. NPDC048825]|uniref:pentapeptide repeat-containing protein n=1 Tax=Streptomyces sp. NPDC048825 TaxID=3365592 RepID=UPI00372393C2